MKLVRMPASIKMALMSLVICSISFAGAAQKQRLLVLTDIGGDPDDQQSMVRLLLYANEFDCEGLIATSFAPRSIRIRYMSESRLIAQSVQIWSNMPMGIPPLAFCGAWSRAASKPGT